MIPFSLPPSLSHHTHLIHQEMLSSLDLPSLSLTCNFRNPVPWELVDEELLFFEGSTLYKEGLVDKEVLSFSLSVSFLLSFFFPLSFFLSFSFFPSLYHLALSHLLLLVSPHAFLIPPISSSLFPFSSSLPSHPHPSLSPTPTGEDAPLQTPSNGRSHEV